MAIMTQTSAEQSLSFQAQDVMKDLLGRLDEAIDDMEQGRVQTIEEAWAEIDDEEILSGTDCPKWKTGYQSHENVYPAAV